MYPGAGLTCVLVLRESHAVLHTWPETGTVNIDIFSCSTQAEEPGRHRRARRVFGAGQVSVQEIPRADGHRPDPVTRRRLSSRCGALAWSLGLFGAAAPALVRSRTRSCRSRTFQARLADGGFGAPTLPVDVTLACSGADALALCVGAILAYPAAGGCGSQAPPRHRADPRAQHRAHRHARPRRRSPAWFEALHLYVWPALLTLAIAGYVFAWMRVADSASPGSASAGQPPPQPAVTPLPGGASCC